MTPAEGQGFLSLIKLQKLTTEFRPQLSCPGVCWPPRRMTPGETCTSPQHEGTGRDSVFLSQQATRTVDRPRCNPAGVHRAPAHERHAHALCLNGPRCWGRAPALKTACSGTAYHPTLSLRVPSETDPPGTTHSGLCLFTILLPGDAHERPTGEGSIACALTTSHVRMHAGVAR